MFLKSKFPIGKSLMWLTVVSTVLLGQIQFSGRVGISNDGNYHDPDDKGSCAWSVAMVACAGAQYVHHDYANHLDINDADMEAEMEYNTTHAAEVFIGPNAVDRTFNCQKDLDGAVANIAAQVNASSADDRFYYALGGPMEVPWRGINAADPEKRQYVTVISHSSWNDDHTGGEMTHKWDDVCNLGVECIHISDQNQNLQENDLDTYWSWSNNHEDANIRWLDDIRMGGDISDAGIVYYILSGLGNQEASPLDVRDLLNQGYDVTHVKPSAVYSAAKAGSVRNNAIFIGSRYSIPARMRNLGMAYSVYDLKGKVIAEFGPKTSVIDLSSRVGAAIGPYVVYSRNPAH